MIVKTTNQNMWNATKAVIREIYRLKCYQKKRKT